MKTLDIRAKEWFDKVNGNSYFSAQITIDFGTETEKTTFIPLSYGHGEYYLSEAAHVLQVENYLPSDITIYCLVRYCRESGIILRYSKERGCLKRIVKAWGIA